MFENLESGDLYVTVVTEGGALLPGVTLTIKNVASDLERVTVTNEKGEERFLSIPASHYDLRAECEGFKPAFHPSIEIQAGHVTTVEVAMTPG